MNYLTAIIIALTLPAMGGSVVIGWQPQPGVLFKIWRGTELVKSVKGNQATVRLPDSGESIVRVTACKPNGYGETAPAEIKLIPVVVQTSDDLKSWETWRVLYIEVRNQLFFRLTPPEFKP